MLCCRGTAFRRGEKRGARVPSTIVNRPARFRGLGLWRGLGYEVPEATSIRSRLLGLAWLDLERAGIGLLLPGCRSIHTFGMRFPLDLVFIDPGGEPIRIVRNQPPGRLAYCPGAESVLGIVPGRKPSGR